MSQMMCVECNQSYTLKDVKAMLLTLTHKRVATSSLSADWMVYTSQLRFGVMAL